MIVDGSVKILHEFIALLKPVLMTLPLSELAESEVFSKWLTFGLLGVVFFSSSVEENKKHFIR